MSVENRKFLSRRTLILFIIFGLAGLAVIMIINSYYSQEKLRQLKNFANINYLYSSMLYYPTPPVRKVFLELLAVYSLIYSFLWVTLIPGWRSKQKFFFNIVFILLFFCHTEYALGQADRNSDLYIRPHPVLLWENIPGYDSRVYRFDKTGFRNDDIPLKKEIDEKRILILGDSTLFGFGMMKEDSIADNLERLLNEMDTGYRWRVVNAAVQGHSSFMGRYIYENRGRLTEPDIIIFGFNNDPQTDIITDSQRAGSPALWPLRKVLYRSEIYLLLRQFSTTLWIKANNRKLRNDYSNQNLSAPRTTPEEFQENLDFIINDAKSGGAEVLVLALPRNPAMYETKNRENSKKEYRDLMENTADSSGVLFLNLYMDYVENPETDSFFPEGEMHHNNARGYKYIAEKIAGFIKENCLESE